MRKTIAGNSLRCYQGTEGEHLNDYIDLFTQYFKNIAHHHCVDHYLNRDAILIYSYFPIELSCSGCLNSSRTFHISLKGIRKPPGVFYDVKTRNVSCCNVDIIYYDEMLVGYYCPKNNVFCVGDIAHEGGQRQHIRAILKGMKDEGLLIQTNDGNKQTITLGADPEFETMINGTVVSARDLPQLSTDNKIYISHDGITQPQRELRPDPANTPEELVENIRDLIKISSFFGEDLIVGGKTLSCGGHIHIGNATPTKELVDILDYFLFPINEFNTSLRKESNYGKSGDVRSQPHGFEYRTPPAVWLLTPVLARMTLELTKNIVEKIINDVDVDISDNYDIDEYKYNLEQLGFDKNWITQFMDEIVWAKSHIDEPLAKTWGVEIPQEYRIKKSYKSRSTSPFEGLTRLRVR
jgi:hypothetical protein